MMPRAFQGAAPVSGPNGTPIAVHLWVAAAIGVFSGLVLFLVRAPVSRCAGGGVVLAAVAFGLLRAMERRQAEWPAPPVGRAAGLATAQRWRMSGFDSMVDKVPVLSEHLRVRLRALAVAALSRRNLPIGSPGAVALLGRSSHDVLFPPARSEDGGRPPDPSVDQLTALLDRLLELSETKAPGSAEHLDSAAPKGSR